MSFEGELSRRALCVRNAARIATVLPEQNRCACFASLTALTGVDGEVSYTGADGQPATKEDGTPYTAEDMAAVVVAFDEE